MESTFHCFAEEDMINTLKLQCGADTTSFTNTANITNKPNTTNPAPAPNTTNTPNAANFPKLPFWATGTDARIVLHSAKFSVVFSLN